MNLTNITKPPILAAKEGLLSRQVGHYELRGRLGSGGGGVVHEAVDSRLGRRVVLKRLHRGADREAALAEARSLSAVEHPNVCPLFDVIEDGAETWLVMPRVEGESLRQLVAHGPLPIPLVLSIGAQVADGLEAAHRLGIVHRDLKPANVMVSPDGRVRILDFGLARATRGEPGKGDSDPARTAPRGTIPYMAPEQFEAGRVTPASDIFALGILLYEAASGFHPFRQPVAAAEPGMLQRSIRFHEPEPLGRRRLEAPDALATLVDRCLAKVPEARPPSAAHVAEALRAIGRERGDVVRTPPPAPPSARPGWLDRVLGRGQAVAVGERRQPPSPPGAPRRALGTAVREAFLEARALLAVVPDGEDVRLRLYRAEDRLADVLREEPSFGPAYAAM